MQPFGCGSPPYPVKKFLVFKELREACRRRIFSALNLTRRVVFPNDLREQLRLKFTDLPYRGLNSGMRVTAGNDCPISLCSDEGK